MLSGRTARSRCSRTAVLQRKLLQPLRDSASSSLGDRTKTPRRGARPVTTTVRSGYAVEFDRFGEVIGCFFLAATAAQGKDRRMRIARGLLRVRGLSLQTRDRRWQRNYLTAMQAKNARIMTSVIRTLRRLLYHAVRLSPRTFYNRSPQRGSQTLLSLAPDV